MRGVGAAAGDVLLIRPPKPTLKSVALPTASDLSEASLTYALEILQAESEGWADVVVHQSELRRAMKVAGLHNAKKPTVRVRVLTEKTLGLNDWRLRSSVAEVRSS